MEQKFYFSVVTLMRDVSLEVRILFSLILFLEGEKKVGFEFIRLPASCVKFLTELTDFNKTYAMETNTTLLILISHHR